MSGISYNLKKIRGLAFDVDGVLSPSVIPIGVDGTPNRMVNVKDGYALQLALKYRMPIAIITGGDSSDVRKRFRLLGIEDYFDRASHKLPVLEKWMEERRLQPDQVLYMGDDIPDLQCMRYVGLPCAPYDAACEVRDAAIYISPFSGGYGCVRDVVRQVLIANNQWLNDKNAFHW